MEIDKLRNFAKKRGLHVSQNVFKRNVDGSGTIMITHRDYHSGSIAFIDHINSIVKDIAALGIEIEKEIIEFVVFDSRIEHDDAWLTSK